MAFSSVSVSRISWSRGAPVSWLSCAWSKLWFPIGFDAIHGHHAWPDQRYFMNLGPYASDEMYLVHLAAAAITAILLVFVLHLTSAPAAASNGHDQAA